MSELGLVELERSNWERMNTFIVLSFSNYGPTIAPAMEATSKGFTQILWLLGEEEVVTEVGTMNQFFFWITPEGKKELITAPLDGTILPGVTRSCILELCREWGEFEVTERPYTMKEVAAAVKEGRVCIVEYLLFLDD